MSAKIGAQIFADHTLVIVTWKTQRATAFSWRLNNNLPLKKEIVQQIKREIMFFFQISYNTAGRLIDGMPLRHTLEGYV